MELGRERKRSKCTGQSVKYWFHIMSADIEHLAKQYYKCHKSNEYEKLDYGLSIRVKEATRV
jgi:hypothetical protein